MDPGTDHRRLTTMMMTTRLDLMRTSMVEAMLHMFVLEPRIDSRDW
jgi:hypothetical protein